MAAIIDAGKCRPAKMLSCSQLRPSQKAGVDLCTIAVIDLLAGHVRKLRRHIEGSCFKTLLGTELVMCNQDSFASHCSIHDVADLWYPKQRQLSATC